MELTLKRLLEQAEFTKSRGRYDAQEVDDLLDRAVAMATKVEARLNQAIEEAQNASGPTEADIEAEVDRRVAAGVAEAGAVVGNDEDAAAQEAIRTIKLAQRTADAAVKEAQEEAAALLAEAKGRADSLSAETDARAAQARSSLDAETSVARDQARAALAAEIAEIEAVRESLRTDAALLERHVQEQRTQLRNAIGELQRLLDDPAGFRLPPVPDLADPEVPDLSATDLDTNVDPAPETEDGIDAGDNTEAEASPDQVMVEDGEEPAGEDVAADDLSEGIGAASSPAVPDADAAPSGEGGEPGDEGEPPSPAPVALAFDEVDHAEPGLDDAAEGGPPTAPVAAVQLGSTGLDRSPGAGGPSDEEDAFLAELRKAMKDDEPLGPRDPAAIPAQDEFFEDDRRSWRFGKRR